MARLEIASADDDTCAFCPEPTVSTFCGIPVCGDECCFLEAQATAREDEAEEAASRAREDQ